MRKALVFIAFAALGGISFWLPGIIVHGMAGTSFSAADVLFLTIVVPAVPCAVAIIPQRYLRVGRVAPAGVIAGIWLLGGLATMVAASFSGGGFASDSATALQIIGALIAWSVPPGLFIAATYDGTLAALIITTTILCLSIRLNPEPRRTGGDYA